MARGVQKERQSTLKAALIFDTILKFACCGVGLIDGFEDIFEILKESVGIWMNTGALKKWRNMIRRTFLIDYMIQTLIDKRHDKVAQIPLKRAHTSTIVKFADFDFAEKL